MTQEPLLNSPPLLLGDEPLKKQRRIKVLKSKAQQDAIVADQPANTNELPVPEVSDLTFWQALKKNENQDTREVLSRTTALMAIVPITVFFLTRWYVFTSVTMGGTWGDNSSLTYSGISAVIAVNIISFGFIIFASVFQHDERLDPEWLDSEVNKLRATVHQKLATETACDMTITPPIPSTKEQENIKEYYLSHANLAEIEYQEKKKAATATASASATAAAAAITTITTTSENDNTTTIANHNNKNSINSSSKISFTDIGDDQIDPGNTSPNHKASEQSELTQRSARGKSTTKK